MVQKIFMHLFLSTISLLEMDSVSSLSDNKLAKVMRGCFVVLSGNLQAGEIIAKLDSKDLKLS